MTTNNYDYIGTLFDNANTNPAKVTVALTMADKAMEKGHPSALIFMIDAVHLALPNQLAGIDIGAPFKPAQDLLENFISRGGKVFVCKSCVMHNGINIEDIDARFEAITADNVVDLTLNAKGNLHIA